jgi:hypothetical protein
MPFGSHFFFSFSGLVTRSESPAYACTGNTHREVEHHHVSKQQTNREQRKKKEWI